MPGSVAARHRLAQQTVATPRRPSHPRREDRSPLGLDNCRISAVTGGAPEGRQPESELQIDARRPGPQVNAGQFQDPIHRGNRAWCDGGATPWRQRRCRRRGRGSPAPSPSSAAFDCWASTAAPGCMSEGLSDSGASTMSRQAPSPSHDAGSTRAPDAMARRVAVARRTASPKSAKGSGVPLIADPSGVSATCALIALGSGQPPAIAGA